MSHSNVIPVEEWRRNKHLYVKEQSVPAKKKDSRLVKGKGGEMVKSETQEQILVANHLRLFYPEPRFWWTATYNGAATSKTQRKMIAAMGGKSGVPDILIFNPTKNRAYCGLAIEMKSMVGTPSENQKQWMAALKSLGWMAVVCQGAEAAIKIIDEYSPQELVVPAFS